MGLLEDLSALALAPLLRETEDAAQLLGERLSRADGSALGDVLRRVARQAWEAFLCHLAGDSLRERCQSSTISAPEDGAFRDGMLRFLDAFPLDESLRAQPEFLRDCLEEGVVARTLGDLARERLDVRLLVGEVRGLLARAADRHHDDAEWGLITRMSRDLTHQRYRNLAELLRVRPRTGELPVVVLAARTFLRLELERQPDLLWGPSRARDEPRERHQAGGLTAFDATREHHPTKYQNWLVFLRPPERIPETPPPPPRAAAPGGSAPQAPAPAPRPAARAIRSEEAAPALAFVRDEALEDEGADQLLRTVSPADTGQFGAKKQVLTSEQGLKRRATVRWYRRMNPERMYPLTVALARGRVKEVRVAGVGQAVAPEMLVIPTSNPFVTVRPVLPGVLCYPPEQTVDVTPELVAVRFQVLPQLLGSVADARIEFYWRERLLSQVPLPMRVSRQTLALAVSTAALLWPFLGTAAHAVGSDAEDSSDVVMRSLGTLLQWPYAIQTGLLATALLALVAYLWNRPRQSSEETNVLAVRPMPLAELLAAGREALRKGHWEEARGYFEDAVNVAPADADARAGLEASRQHQAPAAEGG